MKAYKPYSDCAEENRPDGIDLTWPWQVQDCGPEETLYLTGLGFTVLSDEAYEDLLSGPELIDVSPRQIRLALVLSGVALSSIDAVLNALPEPDRSLALIEWEHALSFERQNGLVNSVGAALELTSEQVDEIWLLAMIL